MVAVTRSKAKSPKRQSSCSRSSRVTKKSVAKHRTKERATPIRHAIKTKINRHGKAKDAETTAALSRSLVEYNAHATDLGPPSKAAQKFLAESSFMQDHSIEPTLGLGDLDNAIHPMFRRENFPTASTEHYRVLEPSLSLASKILESEEMKMLLRTVLFHRDPLQHLPEYCRKERLCTYSERDCSTAALTRRQHRDIDDALKEFAQYITFTTIKSPYADAHTEPNGELTGQSTVFHGSRSIVYYSKSKIDKLGAAITQPRSRQDISLLLASRFHFAVEFAHEICHALQLAKEAVKSDFSTDPFFHGDQIAEVGFVMENRVFGGHFGFVYGNGHLRRRGTVRCHWTSDGGRSKLMGVPVWWDWPCSWLVKEYYASGNLALWGRRGWQKSLEERDVARRIFPDELERYFTKAFWRDGGNRKVESRSKKTGDVRASFRSDSQGVYEPII